MENRFTDKEQTAQCKAFIADCHQKAWGAACHASWLEKSLNELIARYQRLQKEDKEVEAEIKANLEGLDGHTVANRNKRNELAKRRYRHRERHEARRQEYPGRRRRYATPPRQCRPEPPIG
jgi:hypothetical protein